MANEKRVYCPVFVSEDATFEENQYSNRVELTLWTGFNNGLVDAMRGKAEAKGKTKTYFPINLTKTAARELIRILNEKLGE